MAIADKGNASKLTIVSSGAARQNEMVRDSARAAESTTSPESTKGPFGDEVDATAVGSWDSD